MFWRFGGYANVSTIDSILDKEDVQLDELLDEADLIQELKQQNSKLVEYLRDDGVLKKLLKYVVADKPEDESQLSAPADEEAEQPSSGNPLNSFFGGRKGRARSKSASKSNEDEESKEEKQRMKYAYVACEILSCDVWSISEAILENRDALLDFWAYLKRDVPLDPVQAGYFNKVNESLFDKKTEEMLEIFSSIDGVVKDLLRHVDCPTIMDLLLKIISLERHEGGQGTVDWLQSQDLIPILLSYLSSEHEASTQTSAGDFLKAIITISANATAQDQNVIGPNELTRQLVSEPCISQLITEMLKGGNPLTVGVGIVIEVIRKNNSDYDMENQISDVPKSSDPIYLGFLLRKFAENVPKFMELTQNANRNKELKIASGDRIEPLGFDRFKTCELMAELLHCSNMALLNERAAEEEIRKRDAKRELLKAEGKLEPARGPEVSDGDAFGTSVDSSGFHHARAPSFSDDSPEEIKNLEVSNSTEEDFENVTSSEAMVEESKDKLLDENLDALGAALERSPKLPIALVASDEADPALTPAPLSPRKENAQPSTKATEETKPEPAPDADSPTSGGVTGLLSKVGLDSDTEMTDTPLAEQVKVRAVSPHEEDKPAPLFSGKRPESPVKAAGDSVPTEPADATTEPSTESTSTAATETNNVAAEESSTGDDVATADTEAPRFEEQEQGDAAYELDIDGKPVVGDVLKINFVENRVVPTILEFFFRFPWNNFLHNVVYDVIQQVFNGRMDRGYNRALAVDLFENGKITERIVEGQQRSDKSQQEHKTRLGYMGHLTLIAEEVVKFTERHPPEMLGKEVLDAVMNESWIEYVEQTLAETRERDNAILGGVRPDMGVGPRQAVLNAVNAAQGYSSGSSSLGGLSSDGGLGLDSVELSNQQSLGSGGAGNPQYLFSGSSLLSGFNHGSSDEEDEDMDGTEGEATDKREKIVDDDENSEGLAPGISISPLNVPPSRAQRQFQARLAQRRAESSLGDPTDVDVDINVEYEGDVGVLRDDYEDGGIGTLRDEFEDAGGEGAMGVLQDPRSDDSVDFGAGEDLEIVMRKSARMGAAARTPRKRGMWTVGVEDDEEEDEEDEEEERDGEGADARGAGEERGAKTAA